MSHQLCPKLRSHAAVALIVIVNTTRSYITAATVYRVSRIFARCCFILFYIIYFARYCFKMTTNATPGSTTVAAAAATTTVTENAAIPRDQETGVSGSSGSRRRRLPDIPPHVQTVASDRILNRHRPHRMTAEQNGDGFVDVGINNKSSAGSEMQSRASFDVSEDVERVWNPGHSGKQTRKFASTTYQSVENDPSLLQVEESSWASDRNQIVGHDPPRRRQSLFALMRTCRLVSMTLQIPRDDVIRNVNGDVIPLTELDMAGAAMLNVGVPLNGLRYGDTAAQSAFTPVGRAAMTSPAEKSTDTVGVLGDDDVLVVVSAVLRDVMLPGCSQHLLPGDIVLEVQHTIFCYII